MLKTILFYGTLFFYISSFTQETLVAQTEKMNVLCIVADDLGWMDTSTYGSTYYETPNIDALAEKGMLFTNAYAVNPLCSPSRAGILTGRYPARYDYTTATGPKEPNTNLVTGNSKNAPDWHKVRTPKKRTYVPLEEQTIAELLKAEGYKTVHIGKWHLGGEGYFPEDQGFDQNIAGYELGWPRTYFAPYKNDKLSDGPDGEYITDRLTTEAIQYFEANTSEPFFMNLWYFAVHGPFEAKKELVQKYQNKVDSRGEQNFAVMAAMIETFDQNIGRLLAGLESNGLLDNTIIVFTSDNGGVDYETFQGNKITSNAPLRAGKANIHEGGIRIPCIVSWPGHTQPGSVSNQVISGVDIFPTIAEMVGAASSNISNSIDGKSLVNVLENDQLLERTGVFVDFPHYTIGPANLPSTALINNDWKYIRVYGEGPGGSAGAELYRLSGDLGENNNLAADFPAEVAKLDAAITDHLTTIDYIEPETNPSYDPNAENPQGEIKIRPDEDLIIQYGLDYEPMAIEAANFGVYKSDCTIQFDIQPSQFFSDVFIRPPLDSPVYTNNFARLKFGSEGTVYLYDSANLTEGLLATNFRYTLGQAYRFRIHLFFENKAVPTLTVEVQKDDETEWTVLFNQLEQPYLHETPEVASLFVTNPDNLFMTNLNTQSNAVASVRTEAIPTVALYPTLVAGDVNIQAYTVLKSVKLYAQNGQLLQRWKYSSEQNTLLDLSRLSAGIYLLEIKTNQSTTVKRFIKK